MLQCCSKWLRYLLAGYSLLWPDWIRWPCIQTGDDGSDDVRSSDDSPRHFSILASRSMRSAHFSQFFRGPYVRCGLRIPLNVFLAARTFDAHIFFVIRFSFRFVSISSRSMRSAHILFEYQRERSSDGQFQWPVTVNAYFVETVQVFSDSTGRFILLTTADVTRRNGITIVATNERTNGPC